jgi:hypothetical protein
MTPATLKTLVNIAHIPKEINASEADIAMTHRYTEASREALARCDRKVMYDAAKRPQTETALFWLAVNKLAINLSADFVDNQYFKVLIVPQAFIAEVLRDLLAMLDRFSIRVELNADAISIRNAVFHIEKELLHD